MRALRYRRRWRQTDLAAKAGISASLVGLLERGGAETLSVRALRRICSALDLRLGWDAGYRGAELARLRDANHAQLAEWLNGRLEDLGWSVTPEVSFNHFGDRGRIDLMAFHAPTRTLLVVEVKTVIADIQELLGSIHVKERVAPNVARSLGWPSAGVVPCLAVAEGTTNRRRLLGHARLFARFGLRGKVAMAWLREPASSPSGLLLLVKLPDRNGAGARRAGRQRVRPSAATLNVNGSPGRARDAPGPAQTRLELTRLQSGDEKADRLA